MSVVCVTDILTLQYKIFCVTELLCLRKTSLKTKIMT